jgi:hypothetical protein
VPARVAPQVPEARGGKCFRKCFHPEADGQAGLLWHFNTVWQPRLQGIAKVTARAYGNIVTSYMNSQEPPLDMIVPRGYDHNVCKKCELSEVKIRDLDDEIARKKLDIEALELQAREAGVELTEGEEGGE